jgi:hypothetical protein
MFWHSTPLQPPILWCQLMNYELIDQLYMYMTGNTILYIKSVHLSLYLDTPMTRETLFLNMMRQLFPRELQRVLCFEAWNQGARNCESLVGSLGAESAF